MTRLLVHLRNGKSKRISLVLQQDSCLAFQAFSVYFNNPHGCFTHEPRTRKTTLPKKKGRITEGFPFGEDVLVFKVNGKMFLLTRVDELPLSINVKCDPELAIELRERYEAVEPGYHMNKKYWNTVEIDGTIPPKEIFGMIDHSFEQTVKGMRKAIREKLLA